MVGEFIELANGAGDRSVRTLGKAIPLGGTPNQLRCDSLGKPLGPKFGM